MPRRHRAARWTMILCAVCLLALTIYLMVLAMLAPFSGPAILLVLLAVISALCGMMLLLGALPDGMSKGDQS